MARASCFRKGGFWQYVGLDICAIQKLSPFPQMHRRWFSTSFFKGPSTWLVSKSKPEESLYPFGSLLLAMTGRLGLHLPTARCQPRRTQGLRHCWSVCTKKSFHYFTLLVSARFLYCPWQTSQRVCTNGPWCIQCVVLVSLRCHVATRFFRLKLL